MLETLVLSILNHDCAVAAAAARMVTGGRPARPIIEMGSRRTHEQAAVAAARAAYLAGFASTSNLAASRRYGVPTAGTAAHAFTLLHDDERAAFAAQVAALGPATTLLVDTYDITRGIELAVEVAGPDLGAIRIDSGDLGVLARQARAQLDALGATGTRIVVSGDLDEFAIAALAAAPVDVVRRRHRGRHRVAARPRRSWSTSSSRWTGARSPSARSTSSSQGGRKTALRAHKPTGTAVEEIVVSGPAPGRRTANGPCSGRSCGPGRPGRRTCRAGRVPRPHLRAATVTLPWDGLKLSRGEPAIPTRLVPRTADLRLP